MGPTPDCPSGTIFTLREIPAPIKPLWLLRHSIAEFGLESAAPANSCVHSRSTTCRQYHQNRLRRCNSTAVAAFAWRSGIAPTSFRSSRRCRAQRFCRTTQRVFHGRLPTEVEHCREDQANIGLVALLADAPHPPERELEPALELHAANERSRAGTKGSSSTKALAALLFAAIAGKGP